MDLIYINSIFKREEVSVKYFIIMIFLFFSVVSLAETTVYQENGRLSARLDNQDSQRLYGILGVVSGSGRSANAKRATTQDGAVDVNCNANTLGVGVPYGCTVTVDYVGDFQETIVYREAGVLNATLHNKEDAKSFYNALQVREAAGRSGSAKSFQTQDGKAKIFCTKNNLGVGNSFSCTVSISVK